MTKMEKSIYDLSLPIVNELGYKLYDVMYVKEGKEYYLRIFIDHENGIDLDDCEKVSNRISDMLDEVDPISTQYNLEVSSCGLERHLREIEHYEAAVGKNVELKFFKAIDGLKQIEGILKEFKDNIIILEKDEKEFEVKIDDVSSAKILFNWEDLKNE
ncbi:MAG: ribosome maturation factor RimP [Clostridia bacterium]|nr:ribosome maturation factor RimP [Clostridia bacterium]